MMRLTKIRSSIIEQQGVRGTQVPQQRSICSETLPSFLRAQSRPSCPDLLGKCFQGRKESPRQRQLGQPVTEGSPWSEPSLGDRSGFRGPQPISKPAVKLRGVPPNEVKTYVCPHRNPHRDVYSSLFIAAQTVSNQDVLP